MANFDRKTKKGKEGIRGAAQGLVSRYHALWAQILSRGPPDL
jgi:hypothetical protein